MQTLAMADSPHSELVFTRPSTQLPGTSGLQQIETPAIFKRWLGTKLLKTWPIIQSSISTSLTLPGLTRWPVSESTVGTFLSGQTGKQRLLESAGPPPPAPGEGARPSHRLLCVPGVPQPKFRCLSRAL